MTKKDITWKCLIKTKKTAGKSFVYNNYFKFHIIGKKERVIVIMLVKKVVVTLMKKSVLNILMI